MSNNIATLDQNCHEPFARRFKPFRAFTKLVAPFFVTLNALITQVIYLLLKNFVGRV